MEQKSAAELRRSYEQRKQQLMVPADPEAIKDLPLFAGIPEKARAKVVEKVGKYIHVVEYEAGDGILEKGAYSDSAYVIISGAVEVLLKAASDQTPRVRGGAHLPPRARPAVQAEQKEMLGRGQGTSGTVILSVLPAEMMFGKRTILEPGSSSARSARCPGIRSRPPCARRRA